MKDLWKKVWYSEPVRLVGGLVTGWLAVVALDQADDSWHIPLWIYIVAAILVPVLTAVTRKTVTAPANLPEDSR